MDLRPQGIHSLPPEILIQILVFDVAATVNPGQYFDVPKSIKPQYSRLYVLSKVCKLWKAILEGSSLFWAKISSDLPGPITSRLFRQSGSSSLDIIYRSNSKEDTWLRTQLPQHFHRVRNFALTAADELPAVILEDLVGASLETLYICSHRHPWSYPLQATSVFAAQLPQLRRLIHRGAPVTLNWPTISKLTHLEITKCQIRMFGTEDWYTCIFRNNPMLVSVKLRDSRLYRDPQNDIPSSRTPTPVHLNHLTTLNLIDNEDALTFGVLSTVVAPVHSDIQVGLFCSDAFMAAQSESDWCENLDSLTSTLLRQPHSRISLEFSLWSQPRLNVYLDDRHVLRLGVQGSRIRGRLPLPRLVASLCRGTNAVAEVSLSSHEQPNGGEWGCSPPRSTQREGYIWKRVLQNDEDDVWELLASVPDVTILDLQLENPERIVQLLMKSPPTFPKLKRLRLELTRLTPEDFMVPVLQYRNALPTVASLEELMITSRGPGWHAPPAQLQGLLGDTGFVWLPLGQPGDKQIFELPRGFMVSP